MEEQNIHHPWCSLDFVLELISGRWTILIVRELRNGPKRPSELTRTLPKISAKTLTHRLRELEDAGFLLRESFEEIPPRVLYSLTPKGHDLMCVLEALNELGQNWQSASTIEAVSADNSDSPVECRHCVNVRTLEEPPVAVPKVSKLQQTISMRFAKNNKPTDGGAQEGRDDSFFTFQAGDPRRQRYAEKSQLGMSSLQNLR